MKIRMGRGVQSSVRHMWRSCTNDSAYSRALRLAPVLHTEVGMQDFIDKMVEKVGIDKATAEKVVAFLKDHADDAVMVLQRTGITDKLPGGLGSKLSGLM